MKISSCPECKAVVTVQEEPIAKDIRGMDIYDIVDCDECGAELKIMSLEPLRFDVVVGNYEIYIGHDEGIDDYNRDVSSDFYEGGRD